MKLSKVIKGRKIYFLSFWYAFTANIKKIPTTKNPIVPYIQLKLDFKTTTKIMATKNSVAISFQILSFMELKR